jgi:putative MATE family efflux protein
MKDMTQGPIPGHLMRMAIPIAIGMVFQTLYVLVDLYFVAHLGDAAIAGLGSAGNLQFLVMAITQVLGVGTMALISHAAGRKDRADANLVFNQSVGMAVLCGIATLAAGYLFGRNYMNVLGADTETIAAGMTYLVWLLPGLALQFALISMGSALRGTGIVTPTIVVQILTVILNAVLAPILISGWLTGRALGMMGAGLATSISVAVGVVMMSAYFVRLEQYVRFDRTQIRPRMDVWRRILAIGVPPGGEFALMFVYMAFIFWISRPFGADAQAGFSAGTRVMQAIFLPAMAIAFATSPVAGQNFGAGLADRVRHTFRSAIASQSVIMISLTLLCQFHPEVLVAFFTEDAAVVAAGAEFLRIVSFNFLF